MDMNSIAICGVVIRKLNEMHLSILRPHKQGLLVQMVQSIYFGLFHGVINKRYLSLVYFGVFYAF